MSLSRTTHLVNEEGDEGDGLDVVQVVAVLGEHGEDLRRVYRVTNQVVS